MGVLYFSREEYKIGETHRYLILTFSERIIAVGAYVYKAASSDEVMWTETKNMGYSWDRHFVILPMIGSCRKWNLCNNGKKYGYIDSSVDLNGKRASYCPAFIYFLPLCVQFSMSLYKNTFFSITFVVIFAIWFYFMFNFNQIQRWKT